MKKCSVCGLKKSANDFMVRRASKDGLTAACKECLHKRDRERYPGEAERRKELRVLYMSGDAGKAAHARAVEKWKRNNAVKRAAHVILGNAIRDGVIDRPEKCGRCSVKCVPHGHHDDYTKPLKVRWLCASCHTLWHKENP